MAIKDTKHKFGVTYTKDKDKNVYVAYATNLPGVILQDVSLERIKKRLPKMIKKYHAVQIKMLENGIELHEVGPDNWPGLENLNKF